MRELAGVTLGMLVGMVCWWLLVAAVVRLFTRAPLFAAW